MEDVGIYINSEKTDDGMRYYAEVISGEDGINEKILYTTNMRKTANLAIADAEKWKKRHCPDSR